MIRNGKHKITKCFDSLFNEVLNKFEKIDNLLNIID